MRVGKLFKRLVGGHERGVSDAGSSTEQPPPAYSESVDYNPPASAKETTVVETEEKVETRVDAAFKNLKNLYDTIIVIDDSGSMAGRRWEQAKAAVSDLAGRASEYDSDGIEACFLNSTVVGTGIRTAADAEALFAQVDPDGLTPIGAKLDVILSNYTHKLDPQYTPPEDEPKLLNVLVITDGAPTDKVHLIACIVRTTKLLQQFTKPMCQLGIQFVQIGDCSEASAFLERLDNDLAKDGAVLDIVDTIPYGKTEGKIDGNLLVKALTGGFNKTEDKRAAAIEWYMSRMTRKPMESR